MSSRPPYWTEARLLMWRARQIDKFEKIAAGIEADVRRLETFGITENSETLRRISKLLYEMQWKQLPHLAGKGRAQ